MSADLPRFVNMSSQSAIDGHGASEFLKAALFISDFIIIMDLGLDCLPNFVRIYMAHPPLQGPVMVT